MHLDAAEVTDLITCPDDWVVLRPIRIVKTVYLPICGTMQPKQQLLSHNK